MEIPEKSAPAALMINPPVYDFAFYDLYSKPYGLLKIARWLKNGGYRIRFVNALDCSDEISLRRFGSLRRKKDGTGKIFREIIEKPELLKEIPRSYSRYGIEKSSLEQQIGNCSPDIIFITTSMTYWYPGVRETAELCRRIHPGIPLVMGGVYASLLTGHCRRTCGPDFIVEGDGWPEISRILEKLRLPVPALPPEEKYLLLPETNLDAVVLRLNEGCPFRCHYCASKALSSRFVPGDPEETFSFVEEACALGTRNFAFYDDALLINKEKVFLPFLERVIRSGRKLSFYVPNALHIRHLDPETLSLMRKAGFKEIRMGYESSDSEFQEKSDHKFSEDQFRGVMAALKKSGFDKKEAAVYILAGLPGQRREETEKSILTAQEAGAFCRIALYSPIPGTELWKKSLSLSRYPLSEEPLFQNNTLFPMEWEGFTRQDLERLKQLCLVQ